MSTVDPPRLTATASSHGSPDAEQYPRHHGSPSTNGGNQASTPPMFSWSSRHGIRTPAERTWSSSPPWTTTMSDDRGMEARCRCTVLPALRKLEEGVTADLASTRVTPSRIRLIQSSTLE